MPPQTTCQTGAGARIFMPSVLTHRFADPITFRLVVSAAPIATASEIRSKQLLINQISAESLNPQQPHSTQREYTSAQLVSKRVHPPVHAPALK